METTDMKQKTRITATLLDAEARDDFQSGHLVDDSFTDQWEFDLKETLHRVAEYPPEQCAWGLYTLSNGGYFLAIQDEGIETLEVNSPISRHSINAITLSAEAASLLANLLCLEDIYDFRLSEGEEPHQSTVWDDICNLKAFVNEHPEGEGILGCFENFTRDFEAEDREELFDQVVEAFMDGADVEIGDHVRATIGQIVQEGVLRDVEEIVGETFRRLGEEIYQVLHGDLEDQEATNQKNVKEVRNA